MPQQCIKVRTKSARSIFNETLLWFHLPQLKATWINRASTINASDKLDAPYNYTLMSVTNLRWHVVYIPICKDTSLPWPSCDCSRYGSWHLVGRQNQVILGHGRWRWEEGWRRRKEGGKGKRGWRRRKWDQRWGDGKLVLAPIPVRSFYQASGSYIFFLPSPCHLTFL